MSIETQPARRAIGTECRASNENPEGIGAAWQRFMSEQLAAQIPGRTDDKLIAVYCEYEGDHTQPYTFFLGCVVAEDAEPPAGFTARTIPAGQYLKRQATGEMPAALIQEWSEIWASDLERNFVADFEIHDPATPDSVDLFLGVG